MAAPETIYLYRIYCNTEEKLVEAYGKTTPTVCPNNNAHSIDSGNIIVLSSVSSQKTIITQDNNSTGDNYRFTLQYRPSQWIH
jgi:hypothetical protein